MHGSLHRGFSFNEVYMVVPSLNNLDDMSVVIPRVIRHLMNLGITQEYLWSCPNLVIELKHKNIPIIVGSEIFNYLLHLIRDAGAYSVQDSEEYLDNWTINMEHIFHKHPEITGGIGFSGSGSEVEFPISGDACPFCGEKVPGEVMFLNNLQSI